MDPGFVWLIVSACWIGNCRAHYLYYRPSITSKQIEVKLYKNFYSKNKKQNRPKMAHPSVSQVVQANQAIRTKNVTEASRENVSTFYELLYSIHHAFDMDRSVNCVN